MYEEVNTGLLDREIYRPKKNYRALLQYYNTPSRKDGLSPAQKLFGNPVQDILVPSSQSGSILLLQLSNNNVTIQNHPLLSTINVPTLCQISPLDDMSLFKIPNPSVGHVWYCYRDQPTTTSRPREGEY